MIRKILLVTLLAAAAGLAQTVNCVVAVVNGEIITLLDVEIAAEFGLGQSPSADNAADPRLVEPGHQRVQVGGTREDEALLSKARASACSEKGCPVSAVYWA